MTLINLFIILLFVILYSYRHFLMMLFLGCDLKSVIHQDFDDVFTYTYPNLMSVENYWCRGLKGLVHLRPIKGVEVSSLDIGLEISQISMHKYFFYSLIIFILGVFYSVNYFFLSVFFKKMIVRKMLYFFIWIQRKTFKVFFKKSIFSQSEDLVLF